MNKFFVHLVIGMVVMALTSKTESQEIHMYGPRGAGIGIPPFEGGGNAEAGEIQDESELASALGIDRNSLYEDLMRIQEELNGSPLAGSPPMPYPLLGAQNSQEQEDDY